VKWFTCTLRKKLTLCLRLNHPKIFRTRNLYCGTLLSKLSRKPMSAPGTFETCQPAPGIVRLWGKNGSHRRRVKPTRLTQSGHWTPQRKAPAMPSVSAKFRSVRRAGWFG
jgi:hypothetical protein